MDWVGPVLWGLGGAAITLIAAAVAIGLFLTTQVAHGALELDDDSTDD